MPINKDKNISKTILLKKEVEQAVYDLAYKERRSFSVMAAVLIEKALKDYEENKN